jgi:hypothetical protein
MNNELKGEWKEVVLIRQRFERKQSFVSRTVPGTEQSHRKPVVIDSKHRHDLICICNGKI